MVQIFPLICSKLAFISPCLFKWLFLTFLLITLTVGLETVQFLYIFINLCNHWLQFWLYPLYRALYFPQEPGQVVVDAVCHGNIVVWLWCGPWCHCGVTVLSYLLTVENWQTELVTAVSGAGRAGPDDRQETTLSDVESLSPVNTVNTTLQIISH